MMSKLACLTRGKDRAFPAHPRVDRYFPAASIEDARQRLARCIERGDGPGLAIGPTGTGKTLLLQLLATQFAERFDVACLTSTPLCTRRALLQAILFELRQPYRDREESDLRLSLVELLLDRTHCSDGLLLLVDEAHLLPIRLLEELRILSNLTSVGEPRVRLVVAGAPLLDELFAAPELEVFNQRLSARCYLAPLSYHEVVQYARAQVSAAGANPDEVFAPEALEALYQATDGIPRLVNQVCDRALLLAVDRNSVRVDKSLIQAAWADLQQLPTPWGTPQKSEPSYSPTVIEFGSLDHEELGLIEEPTEFEIDEEIEFETIPDQAPAGATMRVFQSGVEEQPTPPPVQPDLEPATRFTTKQFTVDPFAESFQEEEVVLDRFATLESAFHSNTPRVRNRRETSWSQLLQDANSIEDHVVSDLATPQSLTGRPLLVDEYDGEIEDQFDKHLLPHLSRLLEETGQHKDNSPRYLESPSLEDSSVLLIEEDLSSPVLVNKQVERKEYRQLFASLRGD